MQNSTKINISSKNYGKNKKKSHEINIEIVLK